jgi:FtsH-binding integral membrane protein
MIFHLAVGAIFGAVLAALIQDSRQNNRGLIWWEWLLTVLGLLYTVFVIETIYGFIAEGAPQAALVNGVIVGVIAVIWGVLVNRFIFNKVSNS